jgi:hypothetical protein
MRGSRTRCGYSTCRGSCDGAFLTLSKLRILSMSDKQRRREAHMGFWDGPLQRSEDSAGWATSGNTSPSRQHGRSRYGGRRSCGSLH